MDREYEANRIAEMVRTKKLETDRKQRQAQQQKKTEAMSVRQKEKEVKQQQMLQAKAEAAQQQKIIKEAAALSKKPTSTKNEKHEHVGANTSNDGNIKQRQCMMSFLTKRTSVSPVSKYTASTGIDEQIRPDPSYSVQQQAHPPTLMKIHPTIAASPDDRHCKQNPQSDDHNLYRTIANRESFRKVFHVDEFREGLIAKTTLFEKDFQNSFFRVNLSARAKLSRRHRECISVPVFVTVHPSNENDYDNPFVLQQQQPYAEQVHIKIQNRYKYLSFCENVRPPYYGTWSKRSKFVNGKKPFGIDASQLDYEVDSEGEWEEEEDDIGEEIGDDAMEDDEEKELEGDEDDDEDDGWLAADDDIDDGDTDNDDVESANKTNKASKRKLESSSKRHLFV